MNLQVTAPKGDILESYHFPMYGGKAFDIQKKTCLLVTSNYRAYILNDIGTGKTLCALWSYDYLRSIGEAIRMLVIAPLSTLENIWASTLTKHFSHLRYTILHGTKDQRLKKLNKKVDVYIINHHGLYVILDELLERFDIDTVTVDELSTYRNGRSKQLTLTLKNYVARRRYVWGLTGSPVPRAVTDVWGPASCISPWTIPKYFSWFQSELMYQPFPGSFRWNPKPGAEEKAIKCLSPSVRFKLEDVIELPQRIFRYYEAKLSNQQKNIYDEMSKKSIACVKDQTVDALNSGAVLNKLLQIACGYVYTRDGKTIVLDNTPRLQLTVDLIDSCNQKVLLFAPFKSAINGLHDFLNKVKIPHLIIHGGVSPSKRPAIFKRFQEQEDEKVLLAYAGCMAHGVNLQRATMIIWFGPTTSLDMFMQACGRNFRVGQKYKTLVAMIGGSAREKKIYDLLASNEKVQNRFLELIETEHE